FSLFLALFSSYPTASRNQLDSISLHDALPICTVARPETRVIGVADLADLMSEAFRDVAVINIDNSTHSRFNKRSLHGQIPSSAEDRKSTRLNSSHVSISYAVFCLKKKNNLPIV